jgi:hypothetical protein
MYMWGPQTDWATVLLLIVLGCVALMVLGVVGAGFWVFFCAIREKCSKRDRTHNEDETPP